MLKGFNRGFSLIELVIVVVVVGILAAILVSRYKNLETLAKETASKASESAVKSAYALAFLSKKKSRPSVAEIGAQLADAGAEVVPSGIKLYVAGSTYLVPTLQNNDSGVCIDATTAIGNLVDCIGDVTAAS